MHHVDPAIWRALRDGDSGPFYSSKAWRIARRKAVIRAGHRCERKHGGCGRPVNVPGEKAMVDHIEALRDHPELALQETNLRVLCSRCHGKRHGQRRDWQASQGADLNGWPIGATHPWNKVN